MLFGKSILILSVYFLLACGSITYAWPVPDTGDPNEPVCNPHSYTNLLNFVIKDNVTGLMWQQYTAPGTYTWQEALDYANNLSLGGYDDWRLPTILELSTLIDSSISGPGPTINTIFFYAVASIYWSSTASADASDKAWLVLFNGGHVTNNGKTNAYYVRAVRGGSSNNTFFNNGDGTITDNSTGLIWERSTGSTTYTWEQAKTYCETLTLGGKSWRLPTRNELQTLVDYSIANPGPVINPTFFPNAAHLYWSSTASALSSEYSWIVSFYAGDITYTNKTRNCYVRAVSEGRCRSTTSTTVVSTTTTITGTTTTTVGPTTTTSSPGTTTTSTPIAGTGIIVGMITNADTGGVIDGAFINTSGGISKISSDGFYLMLHPAGVFTMTVSATGYLTRVVSCTVISGQDLMLDISLIPVGTTTTTTIITTTTTTTVTTASTTSTVSAWRCPIVCVLGDNDPNIERLRYFRDSILAQSAVGRRIINIYYTNADSINAALERSPALRAATCKVLETIALMVGKN